MFLKTKTGRLVKLPTPEEDAIIMAAAMSDPDAVPLTDEEWEAVKPSIRMGRPPSTRPLKVPTTIRFDADLLEALKAMGKGWQTRVNDAMREWIKTRAAWEKAGCNPEARQARPGTHADDTPIVVVLPMPFPDAPPRGLRATSTSPPSRRRFATRRAIGN